MYGGERVGEGSILEASWKGQVENELMDLRADLAWAEAAGEPNPAQHECIQHDVARAHEIITRAPGWPSLAWLRRWWAGSEIESAWAAVHDAEAAMVMILPAETVHARLPDLRAALVATLDGDGRADGYKADLQAFEIAGPQGITPWARERIKVIKGAIGSASDAAHLNIRYYRNWLLIVSTVVIFGLLALSLAHGINHRFIYIVERGSGRSGADIAQLEAAGATGGLLMALFALIRLQIYSGPVALPLWQALVRVPAGAVAGVAGAAMLQGQVITSLTPQDRSGLIGYAVLFGAAPEILLRFLDKRVNDATAAARAQSDPLKDVPAQASVTPMASQTAPAPAGGPPAPHQVNGAGDGSPAAETVGGDEA